MMNQRILFVDDEKNILMAFRRQLRTQFEVKAANSGREALHILTTDEPFAVIVSDLRMPVMDGIQFFSQAKDITPDSIRILLTGHADLSTAIDAINQGDIFRFLTKPCDQELLEKTLNAGIEQFRLINAEREMMEKTLGKTIKLMSDMLILANPLAYGRAIRIRRMVQQITRTMDLPSTWQLELAATLSQMGCVALPKPLLEKADHGQPLTADEANMYAAHPMVGYKLLESIPRLEEIAKMVRDQHKPYSSYAQQPYDYKSHHIELGSQILKVAQDYDQSARSGKEHHEIIEDMLRKTVVYNTELVEALSKEVHVDDHWESKLAELVSNTGQNFIPGFPNGGEAKTPLAHSLSLQE
jgi:response regulator RpfG family c-di-GMP phosphodiesterase